LLEPVHVYNVSKPGVKMVVPRPLLLGAHPSHGALQQVLKQQLEVPGEVQVEVTWSEQNEPGGVQHELTEEFPVAYLVGRANSWFVEEA
jgi:hypothetical protein